MWQHWHHIWVESADKVFVLPEKKIIIHVKYNQMKSFSHYFDNPWLVRLLPCITFHKYFLSGRNGFDGILLLCQHKASFKSSLNQNSNKSWKPSLVPNPHGSHMLLLNLWSSCSPSWSTGTRRILQEGKHRPGWPLYTLSWLKRGAAASVTQSKLANAQHCSEAISSPAVFVIHGLIWKCVY